LQIALWSGIADKPANVIPNESPIDATPIENSRSFSGT
jgi:hypothetical protein